MTDQMEAVLERGYRSCFASVAERYPSEVKAGPWEIRHFAVSETDEKFSRLRLAINPGRPQRYVPAGTYVGLWRYGQPIMTATPDEMRDHHEPWYRATLRQSPVNVLVGGFGLGMLVHGLLQLPSVRTIIAVEIDPDVISLAETAFASELAENRLAIVCADMLTWKPPVGMTWDVAWFDIWDDLCVDNLKQMSTLKRRFGRRVGWQGCWSESVLRSHH